MRWFLACSFALAAGCFGGDDDVPVPTGVCGMPTEDCDRIVTDESQCGSAEQLCQEGECSTRGCCWCNPAGYWSLATIACLDGCGPGTDAPEPLFDAPVPIDASFPPPDGCMPGDGGGFAVPHC